QDGFKPGGHLRELGVHTRRAVEIDLFIFESVASGELYQGSRHPERQLREIHHTVVESEPASKVRHHLAFILGIAGMALGAVAEIVELFLNAGGHEFRLRDRELALQLKLLHHIALSRREYKPGPEIEPAHHE